VTLLLPDKLRLHYHGFLDLCRTVLADHWAAASLATLRARAAMPDIKRKVFNAYNKDEAVARRMLRRMGEQLEALDRDWK
jgi:hypothetical protein